MCGETQGDFSRSRLANRYNLTKMTKEKQVSNQQYEEVR